MYRFSSKCSRNSASCRTEVSEAERALFWSGAGAAEMRGSRHRAKDVVEKRMLLC